MPQYIGIDPGGDRALGWCVLTSHGPEPTTLESGCCTGVAQALTNIAACIREVPRAAGIDAPLYWARQGDRVADAAIRRMVRIHGGPSSTVNHVNSLRGACLVQGVLSVVALRERWPSIAITESHPKALLRVSKSAQAFAVMYDFPNQHARDAALGALAALAFDEQWPGWLDWFAREPTPYLPAAGPLAYWFPSDEATATPR
jgi:hypothetical protein